MSRARKPNDVLAFAAGALFALGLGVARMTQPAKVIAFLDVAGHWDPSLAFVMVGAIGVHALALRRGRPRKASRRPQEPVDARLVVGAALFGLGWGAVGYCPGPAVVSVATLSPTALVFVASMLLGMGAHSVAFPRRLGADDGEVAPPGAFRS